MRLEGTIGEIEQIINEIQASCSFKVLSKSKSYKNRDPSEHSRVYLDIELASESNIIKKTKIPS